MQLRQADAERVWAGLQPCSPLLLSCTINGQLGCLLQAGQEAEPKSEGSRPLLLAGVLCHLLSRC